MFDLNRTVVVFGVLAMGCALAQAADRRPVAQPYEDGNLSGVPSFAVPYVASERAATAGESWLIGADHILAQQCDNGGFGWPHDDCSTTVHNITAPILLGVLASFQLSEDLLHLMGAMNGGVFAMSSAYDNGEARFGSFTPWFLYRLSVDSGNTSFADFAATEFFDELYGSSYGPTDLDTAGWIAAVQAGRTGAWVNLRPWDFATLVPAAAVLGNPGQRDLFVQAILDGLATLDNTAPGSVYYDLLGVAGALWGLAFADVTSFPAVVAPLHDGVDGITTLEDLASYLASQQNPDGSWYWHSALAAPTVGDEDVQATAYAVLALLEADSLVAASHLQAALAARDWLISLQTVDGGFPAYPGGSENTPVEGEAMSAIVAATLATMIFDDGFESGDTSRWSVATP